MKPINSFSSVFISEIKKKSEELKKLLKDVSLYRKKPTSRIGKRIRKQAIEYHLDKWKRLGLKCPYEKELKKMG